MEGSRVEHLYRPGPLGALVDESGRAAMEFSRLLMDLDDAALDRVRTAQGELRTVRAVVEHVLMAAGIYRNLQRKAFGMATEAMGTAPGDGQALRRELESLAAQAWELLEDKAHWDDDQVCAVVMDASWGQRFDLEQLLEHALAHVLRHRRQVERWLGSETGLHS